MKIEQVLEEAIDTGEVLNIRYHGGSQPGTSRMISPIKVFDQKVRARCFNSNAVKTFIVAKIEVLEENDTGKKFEWDVNKSLTKQYSSFSNLYEDKQSELRDMGWAVCCKENEISLHRKFKNGNLRKQSDICLLYEEYGYDCYATEDGELEQIQRKRARPYSLRSVNFTAAYTSLTNAANKFLNESLINSPNNKEK